MIVPDSIEPYTGWKALTVIQDKWLSSPQRKVAWYPRKRLEARCPRERYEWELVPLPEGLPAELFWVPSTVLAQGQTTKVGWPPHDPPPGQTWMPRKQPHSLKGCSCGIYVVDEAEACLTYLRSSFGPTVLCKIALWGEVVRGDKGARGQYAYPRLIVAPVIWQLVVEPIADEYGVPAEFVDPPQYPIG